MKRLLLDTNIYGEIIFDVDFISLKEKLQNVCVVHGLRVVRDEIRKMSKSTKIQGKNVVVSEDCKTMLVENALRAYDVINKKMGLRTPVFNGYLNLKRWLTE
jgi:hypothetical protein